MTTIQATAPALAVIKTVGSSSAGSGSSSLGPVDPRIRAEEPSPR